MDRVRRIITTSYVDRESNIPVPVVSVSKSNWGGVAGTRSRLYRPTEKSLARLCELANSAKNPVDAHGWGWKIEETYSEPDKSISTMSRFSYDDLVSGAIPGYGT